MPLVCPPSIAILHPNFQGSLSFRASARLRRDPGTPLPRSASPAQAPQRSGGLPGSCSLVGRLELFPYAQHHPPGEDNRGCSLARAGAPAGWTMGAQEAGVLGLHSGEGTALRPFRAWGWKAKRPQCGSGGRLCFERQQQPGCGDPLAGGALQLASRAGRREDERPGKSVMPALASPSPAAPQPGSSRSRTQQLFPG